MAGERMYSAHCMLDKKKREGIKEILTTIAVSRVVLRIFLLRLPMKPVLLSVRSHPTHRAVQLYPKLSKMKNNE